MKEEKSLADKLETSAGPIGIDAIDPYRLQNLSLHEEIRELKEKLATERGKVDARLIDAKPCPFCGTYPMSISDNCLSNGDYNQYEGPAVTCDNEKCSALGPIKKSRKAALAAWNKRSKR